MGKGKSVVKKGYSGLGEGRKLCEDQGLTKRNYDLLNRSGLKRQKSRVDKTNL